MTDIISLPDDLYWLAEVRFNLTTINTAAQASAFNPFSRLTGPSAELWTAELVIAELQDVDMIDALDRFLSKLKGGEVLARLYDKRRGVNIRGSGGATSTVNIKTAASAGAESITVKNLVASQPVALHAMDRIGIGENLYRVTDSAPSDANGWSTLSIRPALRMAVAEGDAVSLSKPTGLFRLVSGDDQLSFRPPVISQQVRLNFTEEPEFA